MSQRLVYFNGEFIPEYEARISIFDYALMFGDMVFEDDVILQPKAVSPAPTPGSTLRLDALRGNRLRADDWPNGGGHQSNE